MLLQRTANAGVLLEMDGVSILLDGVCRQVGPYLETPKKILDSLMTGLPDVVAFTHEHADHFHEGYAEYYHQKTLRPILGPESLPCSGVFSGEYKLGPVTVRPVESRHIGKVEVSHRSYIITGSRCVWFMGDASPLQFADTPLLPKPDILIAPFAYATNRTGWETVKHLHPKILVLVHMPDPSEDPYDLWQKVTQVTKSETWLLTVAPAMGQRLFPQ